MSKTNTGRRRPPVGPLVALVVLLQAFAPSDLAAQRGRRVAPSSPAAVSRREAVLEATQEVLEETGELRRLPPLGPVKSGVKSREQIKNLVVGRLNAETSPRQMRAAEATLRKFGLIDGAFRLRPFMINLLTEQIAGYYDPRAREFYLADWIEVEAQRLVMSHELTHALQDQHFDLRRFENWPRGDADAQLAAHALVEGDATLLMALYMTRNPKRALEIFKSMLTTGINNDQIDDAPRVLRATLLFPYEQGKDWALALYGRGGWDAVSKAYAELPQSTEQILHPEKYFAREAPAKISLPDVSRSLGRDWRRLDEDVNGEWGYYLILSQFLSDEEARAAAAGWAGDRYAIYEHGPSGRLCLVHASLWDSEQEASEFTAAYLKRTAARYKIDATAEPFAAQTREGRVSIERDGARVLIVEGATLRDKTALDELLHQ